MRSARRPTLQEVMSLLDEGVVLYRRYVGTFVLLASLFGLPALLVTFNLLFSLGDWDEALLENAAQISLSLLLTSLLMIPPLTRATRMAIDGQSPSLRDVIRRWPYVGRWFIALMYGGFIALLWLFTLSAFGGSFLCIGSFGLLLFAGLIANFASASALTLLIPLLLIGFIGIYVLYLIICGSSLVVALYSVQPLLDDTIAIGQAIALSWRLNIQRFFYNVLVFFCAALIFSVVALIVTLTIGVLLPAPFGVLFGAEHPLTRGLSAIAWVIGLTAAMPLLPIWSTLHYRQMLSERTGLALTQRVQQRQQAVSHLG